MQRERYVVPNTYEEESLIAVPLMMGEIVTYPDPLDLLLTLAFQAVSFSDSPFLCTDSITHSSLRARPNAKEESHNLVIHLCNCLGSH